MKSARSLGIDALRGFAVLMVVFHHSYVPGVGVAVYDGFLNFFKDYGALGVDLFFVLSGFCIHSAYSKPDEPFAVRPYLLRRWWRIYPPYFFALILAVALNLVTNLIKWKTGGTLTPENYAPPQILAHALMVHNLSPSFETTISGPFWTIAMEAQYYLIYLGIRRFLFDSRGWAAVFIAASVLYAAAWRMQAEPWVFQPLSPFRYWIEWLLGAHIVFCLRQYPALPRRTVLWVSGAVGCAVAGSGLNHMGTTAADLFARVLYALGCVCLIVMAVGQNEIWRSRALRWLPAVGIFSYSIYLIHFIFLDRLRVFVVPSLPEGIPRMAGSILTTVVCAAVPYLFFVYFEKPYMDRASAIRRSGS